MNTNATSGKFWLILTIMLLSGFFNLYAQGNGFWKLERIETREREQVLGKLTRKVTGEPGDLVFSYDNGNNNSRLIVNGSWSALPEILNPNDEVSVSADLKIEKFIPPSHHYSPIVSLSFASGYSSGSIEEMKMSSGYCSSSLVVKATTSNDPNLDVPTASESVSVKAPESPARLKGDIFIIKARMGSTDGFREYYYLYKWQSEQPPVISVENVQVEVWKLERIETREREQVLGKLTRKVTGEPGDLVFSYDNGNNNSRLIVKGSWSALPEILNPNDEVSVSANLKIEKFIPPSHHYSPIVSLSFASGYSSGSIEEMKMSSGYCSSSLVVKATTSNDPNLDVPTASESVSVKAPESPARLKGDIFIIKVRMGSTDGYREYYYLYKWQ